jgi:molybdenum cofactor cytidylyltransferase
VLVVLGHRSEEIAAELDGEGAQIVLNPRYAEGMLTSIQAGIAAAPADAEWFVIALGDQPWLRTATVELLLEEANTAAEEGQSIVVPSYGGRRGHPLIVHSRHRREIVGLDAEVGLRELLRRHPEAVRHVLVEEEGVLMDMDTPQDYEQAVERLGAATTGETE